MIREDSIQNMARDIESGKITVTLNSNFDGGVIEDDERGGWSYMTELDVEVANALLNEVFRNRYPNLVYQRNGAYTHIVSTTNPSEPFEHDSIPSAHFISHPIDYDIDD